VNDYYSLLEVIPDARLEVIKAAYRALININHPDHHGDARKAALLTEAYETLSDPQKRVNYDRLRLKPIPHSVGNYQILDKIAEGGFGTTYKAVHLLTDEPVCIKHCSRISPIDGAILIQEAKAIWDLRHFSMPVMRDLLKFDDGSLGLVMSYIPGPTLEKVVEKNGRMDPEHVAWLSERVINVLKYIHYHGVVHGDVKPQNIIVQPESHSVVIVDFGLALVKPTSTSSSKGYTQCFAPPEEINGLPIIPESDFFSLGMTMIYALNGGNVDRLERREIPASTPKPLSDFIGRLVVKDVQLRPNWSKEDLMETISRVRQESFGRSNSAMKPLSYA
jgi:serine/threonine protein kinase